MGEPIVVLAQVSAEILEQFSAEDRRDRLVTMSKELWGAGWRDALAREMRRDDRSIRRWLETPASIPTVVLIAVGAMLAADRVTRMEHYG